MVYRSEQAGGRGKVLLFQELRDKIGVLNLLNDMLLVLACGFAYDPVMKVHRI